MLPKEYFTPVALQKKLKKDNQDTPSRITGQQKQNYLPKKKSSTFSAIKQSKVETSRSQETLRSSTSEKAQNDEIEEKEKPLEKESSTLDKTSMDSTASVTSVVDNSSVEEQGSDEELCDVDSDDSSSTEHVKEEEPDEQD